MRLVADRFAQSALARRLAALSILALVVWILAPLVAMPLQSLREGSDALASDAALLDRLSHVQARRAEIARLAGRPDAPFFVAADGAAAFEALVARLAAAVPGGAMRIDAQSALPREERPAAPVMLSMSFEATEEGFHAFLLDLETRPPFVSVAELALKPTVGGSGTRLVNGNAVLSAVPFLKGAPQ